MSRVSVVFILMLVVILSFDVQLVIPCSITRVPEPYLTNLQPSTNPYRINVDLVDYDGTELEDLVIDIQNQTLEKPVNENDSQISLPPLKESPQNYSVEFGIANDTIEYITIHQNDSMICNVSIHVSFSAEVHHFVSFRFNTFYLIIREFGTSELISVFLESSSIINTSLIT